ncbi:MAG: S24/S26 family peptidase [Pseudomonadota bacterium]
MTLRRDTPLFVAVVQQVLARGDRVRFVAEGRSMRPAILGGDLVEVGPCPDAVPRIGSIVLARVATRVFLHRVVDVVHTGAGAGVVLRGDASSAQDPQLDHSQVLAVLSRIVRRNLPDSLRQVARQGLQRTPRWLTGPLRAGLGGVRAALASRASRPKMYGWRLHKDDPARQESHSGERQRPGAM